MASPGARPRTTTAGRSRALLLFAAALNLVPPAGFALSMVQLISLEQLSLVAGTGSLAAALCTLYALRLAALRSGLRVLLGGVALLAAMLFIGGDALVRALPVETLGPGLIPLLGLLLHLSAAVTLFTLGLVYQHPRTSAPRR